MAGAPLINDRLEGLNSEPEGKVCDRRIYVAKSGANPEVFHRLSWGVNPSRDHEARIPDRGRFLHASTPEISRKWPVNAARKTLRRFDPPDEQLVFINAWSEWAEGAGLEPDQRACTPTCKPPVMRWRVWLDEGTEPAIWVVQRISRNPRCRRFRTTRVFADQPTGLDTSEVFPHDWGRRRDVHRAGKV